MYLVDTDVISESRKGVKANTGVRCFFQNATTQDTPLYISVITLGELRRGVEKIRHRRDSFQAHHLEQWLEQLCEVYADTILTFDKETAQVWGKLRAPLPDNPLDKQIAATALIHDLIVVTRNVAHFGSMGTRLLNPFD